MANLSNMLPYGKYVVQLVIPTYKTCNVAINPGTVNAKLWHFVLLSRSHRRVIRKNRAFEVQSNPIKWSAKTTLNLIILLSKFQMLTCTQWDKLRSFKSSRSGQSPRGGSPATAARESRYEGNSNESATSHDIAERLTSRSALSAYNGSFNIETSRSRVTSQDRRADPLGLSVLYSPRLPPSADMIFIHGLGGTSHQTWSKGNDPELFWPYKWLPLEPDICTSRIFSFGYDAKFSSASSVSISNLSDFAKSLLFCMRFGKDVNGKDFGIGNVSLVHKP